MSYDQSQYTKDYLEGVAFGFDACLFVIKDILKEKFALCDTQEQKNVIIALVLELDELDAKN